MIILLYGFLGKKFGKVHKYSVKSAGEAVRAMCATLPGFRKAVIDGGSYRVIRGGHTSIGEEDLYIPQSNQESLRIVPVIEGAKGGFFQIILGAILVFAFPPGAALFGTSLVSIGTSLILGGISQLLFSSAASTKSSDGGGTAANNAPSYGFSGIVNTSGQGNPVSVVYGQCFVGSQVISAGIYSTAIPPV